MSFHSFSKLLASFSFFACTSLFAAPVTVAVDDVASYGAFGDANNTVFNLFVGIGATITGFSYNVSLTANSPSFLSEISLAVTDSALNGVSFAPAGGDGTPGSADNFSGTASYSGGATLNAQAFAVGADGILRLEFFESFDDASVAPDGMWNTGTVTFDVTPAAVTPAVPEPATGLLLVAGLTAMGYAGRRRNAGAT